MSLRLRRLIVHVTHVVHVLSMSPMSMSPMSMSPMFTHHVVHVTHVYASRYGISSLREKMNILLVGLVTHPPDDCTGSSRTERRDLERILELRNMFNSVFTLSKQPTNPDRNYHTDGKVSCRGGRSVANLLKEKVRSCRPSTMLPVMPCRPCRPSCRPCRPSMSPIIIPCQQNAKIHHVCFEHIRMQSTYYERMVVGRSAKPGQGVSQFLYTMVEEGVIADGCKVYLPRFVSHQDWKKCEKQWADDFGTAKHVSPDQCPLYAAGVNMTDRSLNEDHLRQLTRISKGRPTQLPYCQFVLHPMEILKKKEKKEEKKKAVTSTVNRPCRPCHPCHPPMSPMSSMSPMCCHAGENGGEEEEGVHFDG